MIKRRCVSRSTPIRTYRPHLVPVRRAGPLVSPGPVPVSRSGLSPPSPQSQSQCCVSRPIARATLLHTHPSCRFTRSRAQHAPRSVAQPTHTNRRAYQTRSEGSPNRNWPIPITRKDISHRGLPSAPIRRCMVHVDDLLQGGGATYMQMPVRLWPSMPEQSL